MPRFIRALAALILFPALLWAQAEHPDSVDRPPSHGALNLGIGHTGLSIGNSRDWNGLRINWQDHWDGTINGVNLTLGNAKHNASATVNGLAVGIGPYAGKLHGVTVGILGAVADSEMWGVQLAGLGAVSNGDAYGITLSGLGTVADGRMVGLNASGLATVANGELIGLNLAGLATVGDGNVRGISIAGLAVVANGGIDGLAAAGLATVTDGDLRGAAIGGLATVVNGSFGGIGVGGLATVVDGDARGILAGGLANVVNGSFKGIAVGGLANVIDNVHGIEVTAGKAESWEMSGASIAGWNKVKGPARGLAIAVFNDVKELHGLEIGLLNRARNNRGIAEWLPGVNFHK
ncbi:MAG TPA: hypothetical protein VFU45_02345 [Gemmatimonadales bacterium]|nr:hypothetical protein [Gemmatimonadales bacterium]